MIKLYSIIEKISAKLVEKQQAGFLGEYKLVLDSNNRITVFFKDFLDKKWFSDLNEIYSDLACVFIEEGDDTYDFLFEDGKTVDIETSRLHLSNLLDKKDDKEINEIPVVTFYSYKGGVGRSTSLASFASHLSIKEGKSVVILDCDFEAPGFTNFFLEDPGHIYYKNGLIEYFSDSEIENVELSSYSWEVSKKFTGNGIIRVFSSGNLSTDYVSDNSEKTHLDHYLNGLSKLDIFNQDALVEKFRRLFKEIKEKYQPDVILIDSRTGFNDVFGISAFRLSDVVVGFFGVDAQSKPGLVFFLNMLNRIKNPKIVLVDSVIPAFAKSRLFAEFKNYTEDIIANIQSDEDAQANGVFEIKTFPIGYNDVLKNIGLPTSYYEDYISLITDNEFPDYTNLFNYLKELLDEYSPEKSYVEENETVDLKVDADTVLCKNRTLALKKQLLSNISYNMPSLYAESITDYEVEYSSNRYFYRRCMEDLFNIDKFLIIGNKGTGKTYIYRSLNNKNIVNELKKRANKESIDYDFVQIVNNDHRFETDQLDNQIGTFPKNLFFERFWKIYIWNVVMNSQKDLIQPSISLIDIKNDTTTALVFANYIKDDAKIVEIEKDLASLDEILKSDRAHNKQIVFIFDELDKIVQPHLWTERISPLINYCRNIHFSCITPKLFLRSDLFRRTSNINNRNELANRTIFIEWQKDEIFAYFFKFVLSHSKKEFFELMRLYDFYPSSYINKTIKQLEKVGNQPALDPYMLKHMCATFFGKYADINQSSRYGESYDWFFNNLKNADETISLRPFIDLITYAVKDAQNDDSEKPILPASYYTNSRVRVEAVKKHFDDLSREEGNTDLIHIFDYIRDKAQRKYKLDGLSIEKFSEMANEILKLEKLKDVDDVDAMINLLVVNGIVRERYITLSSGTQKFIQFALLYKYYLGLSSRHKKRKF